MTGLVVLLPRTLFSATSGNHDFAATCRTRASGLTGLQDRLFDSAIASLSFVGTGAWLPTASQPVRKLAMAHINLSWHQNPHTLVPHAQDRGRHVGRHHSGTVQRRQHNIPDWIRRLDIHGMLQ